MVSRLAKARMVPSAWCPSSDETARSPASGEFIRNASTGVQESAPFYHGSKASPVAGSCPSRLQLHLWRRRGYGTGMSRIFTTSFSSVYPLYLAKVQRKGRAKAELDQVIQWLTGFDRSSTTRP